MGLTIVGHQPLDCLEFLLVDDGWPYSIYQPDFLSRFPVLDDLLLPDVSHILKQVLGRTDAELATRMVVARREV